MQHSSKLYSALAICAIASLVILLFSAIKPASANPAATLYANFVQLTPQEAKAKFAKLTPDQRREVWKQKLKSLEFGKLTDEQVAFVARSLNELNQMKYDGTDKPEATSALYEESIRLFGFDDAKAIFATLGGGNSPAAIKASLSTKPQNCTCSTNQDFCTRPARCTTLYDCEPSQYVGCGWGWINPCNGTCTS